MSRKVSCVGVVSIKTALIASYTPNRYTIELLTIITSAALLIREAYFGAAGNPTSGSIKHDVFLSHSLVRAHPRVTRQRHSQVPQIGWPPSADHATTACYTPAKVPSNARCGEGDRSDVVRGCRGWMFLIWFCFVSSGSYPQSSMTASVGPVGSDCCGSASLGGSEKIIPASCVVPCFVPASATSSSPGHPSRPYHRQPTQHPSRTVEELPWLLPGLAPLGQSPHQSDRRATRRARPH